MKVADKDKLYDEVSSLEKTIRKAHPKQSGRVLIANIKGDIDMCVGRMDLVNESQWLLQYRDRLREVAV